MTDRLTVADLEAACRNAMHRDDWGEVERVAAALDRRDVPPRPASLVNAALWYAEQGLRVFPLAPGSKIPRKGSAGCKDATTDAEQIRVWWREDWHANVGLATGHLVDVVDFDGALGHAAWSRVFPQADALVPGAELLATVSTPRPGGLHAYVRAAGAGNRAGMVPGVDYRGAGGYVVAPPSHVDNGSYRFLRPLQPNMRAYR